MFDVLQRKPSPRSMVCNTAGGLGDARSVIRGLLAVGPVALLVACGVPAAQSRYADNSARTEAAVATRVVTSTTPDVEEVAARPSAVGAPDRAVARAHDVPPRNVAQDGCNPNYTPCVPDDPVDVDCAGGSGNGPSYVTGPVLVVGKDVYGLDADHNGVGCEAGAAPSSAPGPRQAAPAPAPQRQVPPSTSQPRPRPVAPPSTRPPATVVATTESAPSSAATAQQPALSASSGCGHVDGGACP